MSHSTVRKLLATGLAAVFALTAPATAWCTVAEGQSAPPSLAELARKEAERRKTSKDAKAKRVITTKDLPESARRPASAPAAADGTAPAPEAAGPAGTDQKPAASGVVGSTDDKGEVAWKGRITQAREDLRRNEVFLEALQTRVNALGVGLVSPDSYQQIKVRDDRLKAIEEMERVKADIEQSKKRIADIEEEARKAGVPPGWVR